MTRGNGLNFITPSDDPTDETNTHKRLKANKYELGEDSDSLDTSGENDNSVQMKFNKLVVKLYGTMLRTPETPTLTNDERQKALTTLDDLASKLGDDATQITLTLEQAWKQYSTLSTFRAKESSSLILQARNSWKTFEELSPRAKNSAIKNS